MHRARLAAAIAALASAAPMSAQYGDLAPGGAMSWSLSGVRAEVGVRFAVDPALIARRVPTGFRPLTLGSLAEHGDSLARAMLATRPALANYVLTSLAFARLDTTVVEGDTGTPRALTFAFWWVPVRQVDLDAALPDDRARPGEHLVELGLWSADARFGKQLGAVMPTAVAAPVTVTWDGAGGWRTRLTLPDASIIGSCRLVGNPRATQYRLPAFSTVWAADSLPRSFAVFTYYGHQTQACQGSWRATGEGALARALRTGVILGSDNQIGWRARAAAYSPR